ncbi:MAG: hypothetical protein U5L75_02790 [Candidatus Campbellbacteria bacterium]|nr:hypothetical protein [Candidatus Campbellbacteria bacterium]
MNNTIVGAFSKKTEAEGAIRELLEVVGSSKNISYIYLDGIEGSQRRESSKSTKEQTSESVAGVMATKGAISGTGRVFVAGDLADVLGMNDTSSVMSDAVTAIIRRGLVGSLARFGVAREDAETYEERVRAGEILVVVQIDSKSKDPESIKEICRAYRGNEIRSYKS